ncbi:MAG: nucleotidyltransferase domain-containing protein [Candidatus Acidiferrales bacterium]
MPDRVNGNSAEVQVLVLCARKQMDAVQRRRLSELVARTPDWALLQHLAGENGLLSLLQKHLLEAAPSSIPPHVLEHISQQSRENALRGLFLSAELLRILDKFRERDIQAVPYKGPVLAARAYGSPSLRQFDDLDIVTPQKFMPVIYEAMDSLDYQARLPRDRFMEDPEAIPGEYVFVHRISGAMVELHTEWTLRHFPVRPDVEAMVRRSMVLSVDGKDVPAFLKEDDLLMLAVHGAKDFWARLIWVADIAELVKQSPSVDWESVIAEANRLKVTRMLNLGLSLAREIVGLGLPPELVNQIEADGVAKRLTRQLSAHLVSGGSLPNGLFQRSLYRIRMIEGPWGGLRYWARLSTAPAEEDWEMTDIPSGFSISYKLLRPFRLWEKYRQRTPRGR